MQRIVFLVVVLFVIWKLATAFGTRARRRGAGADDFSRFSARQRDRRQRMRTGAGSDEEDLVECVRCGTWVPASQAVVSGDGAVFCSGGCRDRAPAAPAGSAE